MRGLRRMSGRSRAALAGAASVLVIAGGAGGAMAAADDQEAAQADATTTRLAADEGRGPGGPPPGAEAVQELLGLDQDEIREARESGSSLAEIAEGQGVSLEELTATIVTASEERLDEAVASPRVASPRTRRTRSSPRSRTT